MVAVIENYGGSVGRQAKICFLGFAAIKNTPRKTRTTNTDNILLAAENAAKEPVQACMFLCHADMTRYGYMVIELQNNFCEGKGIKSQNNMSIISYGC
jgi:hypothetical protein